MILFQNDHIGDLLSLEGYKHLERDAHKKKSVEDVRKVVILPTSQ